MQWLFDTNSVPIRTIDARLSPRQTYDARLSSWQFDRVPIVHSFSWMLWSSCLSLIESYEAWSSSVAWNWLNRFDWVRTWARSSQMRLNRVTRAPSSILRWITLRRDRLSYARSILMRIDRTYYSRSIKSPMGFFPKQNIFFATVVGLFLVCGGVGLEYARSNGSERREWLVRLGNRMVNRYG